MSALERVAEWKVVDDLISNVYAVSSDIEDRPVRDLVREAAGGLGPLMPLPALLARLEVLASLLVAGAKTGAIAPELSRTLGVTVSAAAQALQRLALPRAPLTTP